MLDFTQVSIETMQEMVRAIGVEVRKRIEASGEYYSSSFEHSITDVVEDLKVIDEIIKGE